MNQSEEIEVMHQENARLEANEARSVTEIESLTNEIERLKSENERLKRRVENATSIAKMCLSNLPEDAKVDADDWSEFIARHKAEQEVIAAARVIDRADFEYNLDTGHNVARWEKMYTDLSDALRGLDTVGLGPHAPNQDQDNG